MLSKLCATAMLYLEVSFPCLLFQYALTKRIYVAIYPEEFFGGLEVLNCGQEAEGRLNENVVRQILWVPGVPKANELKQGTAY